MSRAGRFITLEGGEGAGKSTVLGCIADWVRGQGHALVETREPGGTGIGERLRGILLDPACSEMAPETELLLMFAARAQHVAQVIQPALDSGQWVICDRFTDASMAYQGHGRGLGAEPVEALMDLVHPNLMPDLTILLDLPVAQGLERARDRGQPDRFESGPGGFLERVRQGYREMAGADPKRFAVIDAGQPLEQVRTEVIRTLKERLT